MTIFLLFLVGENLQSYLSERQILGAGVNIKIQKNNELLQEKNYWESIVFQNPSYLPGFIELTNINLELGNRDSAIINLIKARQINPNSEEIKRLEKFLTI
jgi:hypothetical protein